MFLLISWEKPRDKAGSKAKLKIAQGDLAHSFLKSFFDVRKREHFGPGENVALQTGGSFCELQPFLLHSQLLTSRYVVQK